MGTVSCASCGEPITAADMSCPCGCPDRVVDATASIRLVPGFRLHAWRAGARRKKWFFHLKRGREWNHDRSRHENVSRVYNREDRLTGYKQVWTDEVTGEKTFEKGPGALGDESMHGQCPWP